MKIKSFQILLLFGMLLVIFVLFVNPSQSTSLDQVAEPSKAFIQLAETLRATPTLMTETLSETRYRPIMANWMPIRLLTSQVRLSSDKDHRLAQILDPADLSISKLASPSHVIAGQLLTYTVTITNTGPDPATNVTMTDSLPAAVRFSSVIPQTGCSYVIPTHQISCNLGDMPLNSVVSATIVVNTTMGGTITNTATVTSTITDPITTTNTTSLAYTVAPAADLQVIKTESADPILAGDILTYTIVVTNNGPDMAANVLLTDTLPAGITFRSVQSTQGNCPGPTAFTITCSLNDIANGGSVTVIVAVTANSVGLLSNTVNVASPTADLIPGNNTHTIQTIVNPQADLSITKADNPDPVIAGNVLTYTLSVHNNGPSDAATVTVTDILPAGVTFLSSTPGSPTCALSASTLTCTRANLAASTDWNITIVMRVNPSTTGSLSNTATVNSAITDKNPANNTSSATTTVTAPTTSTATATATRTPTPTVTGTPPTPTRTGTITPNPTLVMTVKPTEAKVYEKFTYTVRITNPGAAVAEDSILTDAFPAYLDVTSATSTRGTVTKTINSVAVNIGSIAPGDVITVTIVTTVNNTITSNKIFENSATLTYYSNQSRLAKVSVSIKAGSQLPGTGELPGIITSENPSPPVDWSLLFLCLALGLAAVFSIWYGFWARSNLRDGAGRALGIGLLLVIAAVVAGVAGFRPALSKVNPPGESQPLRVGFQASPTPEMLAGYEIAPAHPDPGDITSYTFAMQEAQATLPAFPIPTPTFIPTTSSDGETPDTSSVVRLVIPALSVDAEVKYVPFDEETWLISGLKQEIAWLGNSSWPGLGGNTALAGHVTVRGIGNGPFRYLDQLKTGDILKVYTERSIYTYRVREQIVVGENDLWVIESTVTSQLTLITCTDWNNDFQTYLKRLAVFADLESSTPITTRGSR